MNHMMMDTDCSPRGRQDWLPSSFTTLQPAEAQTSPAAELGQYWIKTTKIIWSFWPRWNCDAHAAEVPHHALAAVRGEGRMSCCQQMRAALQHWRSPWKCWGQEVCDSWRAGWGAFCYGRLSFFWRGGGCPFLPFPAERCAQTCVRLCAETHGHTFEGC